MRSRFHAESVNNHQCISKVYFGHIVLCPNYFVQIIVSMNWVKWSFTKSSTQFYLQSSSTHF